MENKGHASEFYFDKQFINQIVFPDFVDFQERLISRNIEFFSKLKKEYKQTLCVVVPTKDEEDGIKETVELSKLYADKVLVIDGNSKDKTREIAESCGVEIVLDNGKGKGSALRQAIDMVNEFDPSFAIMLPEQGPVTVTNSLYRIIS